MAIPRVAPGTVGIDAALGRGKASILDSAKRLSARAVAAAAMLCLAAPATAGAEPPALLVVLAVDQLRAGYIETYGHQWHAGLRRLIDDGAWFENAAYPYRATVTCAGHATIATGSFPARHGMVGNSWWDRADAAQVTCTTDASQTPIAYGGQARERHGPAPLRTATLADVLRAEASGQSRVVSMSLKPRSAITLAGQAADAVTWFDAGGVWATSTAYSSAPVDAVRQFVAAHPVEQFAGEAWERLLPPGAYLHDDNGLGESPPAGWNARFPHPFGEEAPAGPAPGALDAAFYSRWRASPHSDEYLGRMAGALIEAFELGAGDRTDYLAIGFSAVDYIGHRFGPRSHEVQDALVRLDRTLGRLLETLDARVGRGRYVVALSADHGVSPVPEQAAARGVDAGRLDTDGLEAAVEALLASRLGQGPHVAALRGLELYFEPGVYESLRADPDGLQAVLALLKQTPGVWRVYQGARLQDGAGHRDPIARAAALSYFEGRSGDLILIPKPYWISPGLAASHGSPFPYDTRVPVVLYGAGVAPGRHAVAATPADIAPTLAALAGVTLPAAEGRVLAAALARD